ncbi:MAG: dTMP kinase [Chloroflexi bacterium]|nr:dTMP kinase [Chloroflexota bacterium]
MGYFITLEGPDGGGKTTQAQLLVCELGKQGYDVLLTREPGGTDIGDEIRAILHDRRHTMMDARTEILLYSASRSQHVVQTIIPALEAGRVVISDRYADSTLAYQGYGRGLDLDMLRVITSYATRDLEPDLTLCLDIAPEDGLRRRRENDGEWNRLDAESLEFHHRTRAGYLELAGRSPSRWVIIDAARPAPDVFAQISEVVSARLAEMRISTEIWDQRRT